MDRRWIDRRQVIGFLGMAGLLTVCTKPPARERSGIPVQGNDAKGPDPMAPGARPQPTIPETTPSAGESMAAGPMPSPSPSPSPLPSPSPAMAEEEKKEEAVEKPKPPARTCVLSPAQIEGPYFVDEKLERSDIRSDPSNGKLQAGTPLSLTFYVSNMTGMTCEALAGATFDIWHANPEGIYSDVTGALGKKYLRGYQKTDSDGKVAFKTIYPGWYPGRAVHIHIKVRVYNAAKKLTFEFTSQIYFDDAVSGSVFAKDKAYSARGPQDTSNKTDGFYNGAKELLIALEKDGDGYKGSLNVGVKLPPV